MRRAPTPSGTYSDWWWPSGGFASLEHVLTPELDPGEDTTYFWAHQFRTAEGEGGYLGLQTKGNRADGSLGKMAIFSFWDTLAAEGRGAVRFGGEGEGWSCRIPYYWEAGRSYRLRLERVGGDTAAMWWGAWVADLATGEEEEIGQIASPARWGRLGAWSVMWTEYYGGPLRRCADLPYSRVTFSVPSAEGGTVRPVRWAHKVGNGTCPNSRVTELEGGVRHEMGMEDQR